MTSRRDRAPPPWHRGFGLAGPLAWVTLTVASAASAQPRTEFGFVPIVGGDTDYGLGVGQLSSVGRLAPGVKPYVWRLETGGFISFKSRKEEGRRSLISPYQDLYALLTIPHFFDERARLDLRPSFTRETTQRYYGLGNASMAPPSEVARRDFYTRRHPSLSARLRWRFFEQFFWELGTSYTENSFHIDPVSTLAHDMAAGSPLVRQLLGTARPHGVVLVENSLVFDDRDNEIATERGLFLQLKLRYSPHLADHVPYSYGQVDLTDRYYFPLIGQRLRGAIRTVVDLQFGDVPFYELARFEDTFALGGGNGVRGVPGQRYYGRAKVFANFELHAPLHAFVIRNKGFVLASALFADLGRLWATLPSHAELDGTGLGLKYGLGAGLRLQEGETFLVRLDIAWSPDARPIGAYLTAGQEF